VLAKTFALQEFPQIEPRFNIAPHQLVAAVRHIGGHNRLDLLTWGLLPGPSNEVPRTPITVASETVHDDQAFQHAVACNRCILPASGFYEWLPKDDRSQPYYVRLSNSGIMGFAGFWLNWQAEDGAEIETCCILTTAANEVVSPIHERMPAILQPEDYTLWLDRHMHDTDALQRLFRPFPSDSMIAHPVPDLVNNPRFDSPACIVQV
jgi:putative SOS response-associated peptidase YedK